MSRSTFRTFLLGLSAGVLLAWILEAVLVGRGVVSTYLAPVVFIGPVIASLLRSK
jgi:hypothetical protein